MNFASRITRSPVAFDPDLGAEARALFPDLGGEIGDVIAGAGGCSPYLKMLMTRETDWILAAFDAPETAVTTLFFHLRETGAPDLPDALRRAKRRIALLTGLADLAGVWSLEEVTGALTRFADLAVELAMRATIGAEIKRGKMPGMGPDDLHDACGMVALAMGKMGAFELNYSSDIDLICLFDETRFERDDFHDARSSFVRATRRMAAMLNDLTGEGYVFRTDLRLRPDPAVTPVCISMEAAERYYESLGRTWERAAYIKARPAAGDLAAGGRFLDALKPFIWRKHLDFAAIQDAHDMRLRIRQHKGLGGAITLPGHDMKLGRGGIREIEFFTQTRQIIAGGRDPDLRCYGTCDGLAVLAQKEWITHEAAKTLSVHYRAHREVEHRVQMVNDAQTHRLPRSDEGLQRIACFMGVERATLEADLMQRLSEVHDLTEGFFAPDAADVSGANAPGLQGEQETTDAPDDADDSFARDLVAQWPSYPALRSQRATEIFRRLRPEILARLRTAANPQEAVLAFDGFLAGLPAGVQLFSLFEANPHLIDLLADIVGTAPELARHLSRNSSVFDAVIVGDFFAPWPGMAALKDELSKALNHEPDYENKLDLARRWAKEWHFRVGVHFLRGLIDADTAGAQYGDLAEASVGAIWPEVVAQFEAKHGKMPGRGACVIGMGSLGAGRLNAASDLDLIVIYDPQDADMSDGRRPLSVRPYFARLTQAMITAITAQMAQGRLYEVDLRLRPSGNKGPVATSWQSFQNYQEKDAWVWEHLALTRARVVAHGPSSDELARDFETFRTRILAQNDPTRNVLGEVANMRTRIAAAKSPSGPWEAKIGPGRMQDIELCAQAGALMSGLGTRDVETGLGGGVAIGWLSDADKDALVATYRLCWQMQVASKLLSEKPLDPDKIGQGAAVLVLRETSFDTLEEVSKALDKMCAKAQSIIETALSWAPQDA